MEKKLENDIEMVKVDAYWIPANQVETYRREREELARRAAGLMQVFCATVTRCADEAGEGEVILGLDEKNAELCRVHLNPFDVAAYKTMTDQQMLQNLQKAY